MKDPFKIYKAKGQKVPIILSIPHAGTKFPKELKNKFDKRMRQQVDDTDWYVDQLYQFVQNMGITIIKAKYSRWVIDLNRDPQSEALYNDGRIITGLTPTTDFFGNNIYRKEKFVPNTIEINRRLENYYWPYYKKIEELLKERKSEFGNVLLWDAHSIREFVPTIRKEKFPDLILGNNNHVTAHPKLTTSAIEGLKSGSYQVSINTPFKGGHITRYFGKPENNIHALQLEMNKILYMDNRELNFDEKRAIQMRDVLKNTLEGVIKTIYNL
ncbi:N-formylglutamate deformylase [Tamlana haliotis]|uniref:N-formylglutamate deformylase n=1 Tax=Pseudotamlana haliotis TaxID=2614804 RepID=A0A6N6MD82_9FLAO|nr:N-formylglutamate amidohydrolase [Tamlana haliotis]KAB1068164.1 N-formylglutamate deformylase [Tamlana haliotis]